MKRFVRIITLLILGAVILIPAQSVLAKNGLDLNRYCSDKGWGRATLNGGDTAYDWRCQSGSTYRNMILNEACRMQYSNGYTAKYRNFNDPYSWYCQAPENNNRSKPQQNTQSSSPPPNSNSNSSNTVTATITISSCPNNYTTGVRVGGQARVTPGLANLIRSGAGTGYSRVGSAQPGVVFDIIGGPICANGFKWWQIDYRGTKGWTVEGDDDDAWIEVASNNPNRCSVPLRAYDDSSRGGQILKIPLDPLPSNFTLYFEGRTVPNSDWGVRHDGYAGSTSNGNTYLGIGRRWIVSPSNLNWGDDSQWFISYPC